MGVSDVGIHTKLEWFEQTARECEVINNYCHATGLTEALLVPGTTVPAAIYSRKLAKGYLLSELCTRRIVSRGFCSSAQNKMT
jgi:hypothetical protein